MSDTDLELVRTMFEKSARVTDPAGARLDMLDPATWAVLFEFLAPEIELHEDPRFPEGGVYRGHDALRRYTEHFTESFAEFFFESAEFRRVPDGRILSEFQLRMRGKESGVTVEESPAWLYTVEDGSIVRIEAFLDRAEAHAAAGIGQSA